MKLLSLALFVVGVVLMVQGLLLIGRKKTAGEIHVSIWAPTPDWTTTISNKVYRIEFGFRDDGVLMWRKGQPQ